MTNGTEGGVLHLLRLTRTQCHAWVAFVALRREDGTIDITAVPGADDESSEWTLDTLQGIVRQTLEDPLIGEGRAVIRVSEVFRRYWPGERQYTRMAVAPLNDVAMPGRPWGLLCALDPVDGQFSEVQLDMLGRLAVRFINHLRARRQFVEDTEVSDALLSRALREEPPSDRPRAAVPAPEPTGQTLAEGEPLPDEGILRIERAATWLARQGEAEPEVAVTSPPAAEPPAPPSRSVFAMPEAAAPQPLEPPAGGQVGEPEHAEEVEVVFGDAFRVEGPTEIFTAPPAAEPAVQATAPASPEAPAPAPAQAMAQEVAEVVAEPEIEQPLEPAHEPAPVSASEAPTAAEAARTAPPAASRTTEPTGEPVPIRQVRLSELIDQLEATVERLRSARRNGALFLVELPAGQRAPEGSPLLAAADRLAEATRFNDVVLAVGSDMVAVVMELGPRPAQLEVIRERLLAASAGAGTATEDLRASTVGVEPEAGQSAESLVLSAVRQLGAR